MRFKEDSDKVSYLTGPSGWQLALRVDNQLYYSLTDPTGLSLTLTDAQGAAAGHVVYDAYGGILTSTLSMSLTNILAGQGATAAAQPRRRRAAIAEWVQLCRGQSG